jgi:plastocyanin
MPAFTYVPAQTDIAATGVVSFEFPAEPHNVIFKSGSGGPIDIQVTSNVIVTRQFNTAGTFPYECTIHPGMAGTVVVH